MPSVTTNANMQIVEVAPLLRLRTEGRYQVMLIADKVRVVQNGGRHFAAADARKSIGFRSMAGNKFYCLHMEPT